MAKLTSGFKLFQPWATHVVQGKLNFLVRAISTDKRGRIAVIATDGLDGYWIQKTSDKEIERIARKIGVIGSVEIKNCVTIKLNDIEETLIEIAGKRYFNYYPKYLIPHQTRDGNVSIWFLDKAKERKKPLPFKGGGIVWANLKK
jgi:hypothetical protein